MCFAAALKEVFLRSVQGPGLLYFEVPQRSFVNESVRHANVWTKLVLFEELYSLFMHVHVEAVFCVAIIIVNTHKTYKFIFF